MDVLIADVRDGSMMKLTNRDNLALCGSLYEVIGKYKRGGY